MMFRVALAATAVSCSLVAAPALAADLPVLKTTASNKVPACATPGRMMAFAQSRNRAIAEKFDVTATEYMRHGEALQVRWDYAFFQMLVETANLSFRGDVKPSQNNFAGLGATGGGEPGESFDSVSLGVKAHLQHILMYAGEQVQDPVAERTRKVQEWGVLTKWQQSLKGPMTFAQLTRKWSPKDRGYARDIEAVADAFYGRFCNAPDPRPQLVSEARGKTGVSVDVAAAVKTDPQSTSSAKAVKVASKAISDTRETSGPNRLDLGTGSFGATMPQAQTTPASPPATYTILNGAKEELNPGTAPANADTKVAMAAGAVAAAAPPAASPAKPGCRVWQASYGGQKAVIIKAVGDGQTNYTVLDVNEGREQREVAAYIAAYAKDGKSMGEFQTPGKALDKAFELCPEG